MTTDDVSRPEFSVWWWDADDRYYPELRFVPMAEAVDKAWSMTRRPAAEIGIIKKVIITDGGDTTVFEWQYGKGVIFPTKEQCDAHRASESRQDGGA